MTYSQTITDEKFTAEDLQRRFGCEGSVSVVSGIKFVRCDFTSAGHVQFDNCKLVECYVRDCTSTGYTCSFDSLMFPEGVTVEQYEALKNENPELLCQVHYLQDDLSGVVGKVPVSIEQIRDDQLRFEFSDGNILILLHDQQCCESVTIEDVTGDWDDLLNVPLLVAEERTDTDSPKDDNGYPDESATWTFYTFRSIKGSVDVRWYGHSNGFYSERVDAYLVPKDTAPLVGLACPSWL